MDIAFYVEKKIQRNLHRELSLYCASCAGQNQNKAMLIMISCFINSSVFVETIKITYLLPGYTMMPVDSVHSTIESFTRNRTVWAPSEWHTITLGNKIALFTSYRNQTYFFG